MFDIQDFMNAPVVDETSTVKRGSEEFVIRRLNGAERLRFNDLGSRYDRVVFVLARCLLSGTAKKPIGPENAAKFVERYDALAEGLFNDIFELTEKSLKSEETLWELAKKNSNETPADSTPSDDDIVDATA